MTAFMTFESSICLLTDGSCSWHTCLVFVTFHDCFGCCLDYAVSTCSCPVQCVSEICLRLVQQHADQKHTVTYDISRINTVVVYVE